MPYVKNLQDPLCYSVLMIEDGFGFGYIAQPTNCNHEAMNDGWVLLADSLTLQEACAMRDDLKSGAYTIEELAS